MFICIFDVAADLRPCRRRAGACVCTGLAGYDSPCMPVILMSEIDRNAAAALGHEPGY